MRILLTNLALILACTATASAQPNVTVDTPYQVRFVQKLKKGDFINLTNAGALGSGVSLCAHVYALDPAGQMAACCGCPIPSLQSRSLAVGADIFPGAKPPKAATIKVLGSATVGGTCNPAAPGALAAGLVATKGELPFAPATLSAGELSALVTRCGILNPTPTTCTACTGP